MGGQWKRFVDLHAWWRLRQQACKFTEDVEERIYRIANGKSLTGEEIYTETLDGRINEALDALDQATKERISRAEEQKREIQGIVTDISHQVKTPLANLTLYQEMLRDPSLTEEDREKFLDIMESQIWKLDFLFRSMVKMSRLESGLIRLAPKNQRVSLTVARAVSGILPKVEEKGLKLLIVCEESIQAVHDWEWTAEALENVLDNGVKYTGEGGSIEIRVKELESFVKISVSDTGPGIREEEIQNLFKRFYRGRDVREVEGTGLGLYLTREILRRQGGFITGKNGREKGSIFELFLPRRIG